MYYIITIVTIVVTLVLANLAPAAVSGVTAATSDVTNVGGITRIEADEVEYIDFSTVAIDDSVDRSAELDYIAADSACLSADKYRTMFHSLKDYDYDIKYILNHVEDAYIDMPWVKITSGSKFVAVIIWPDDDKSGKYAYFYSVFDAAYYCGTLPAGTSFDMFVPEEYHLNHEEVDLINEVENNLYTSSLPIDIDTYYSLNSEYMLTEEREAKLRKAWIDTPEYTPALLEDIEELSSLL